MVNMKQNWLSVIIVSFVILFTAVYFYIQIKEHNLNVSNSMRLCANLSGDSVQDCSKVVRKSYIGKYASPDK